MLIRADGKPHRSTETGHGRREIRVLSVITIASSPCPRQDLAVRLQLRLGQLG
jgi:hypothetical protein